MYYGGVHEAKKEIPISCHLLYYEIVSVLTRRNQALSGISKTKTETTEILSH